MKKPTYAQSMEEVTIIKQLDSLGQSIDVVGIRMDSLHSLRKENQRDSAEYYSSRLEGQMAFLNGFSRMFPCASLEMRYIRVASDPFRIQVYLLARIASSSSEENHIETSRLANFIVEGMRSFNPDHEFSLVQQSSELEIALSPFSAIDVAEIVRRDGSLPLDTYRHSALHIRGFSITETKETQEVSKPPFIYLAFPFLLSDDTRERLCAALLAGSASVCISIMVSPYVLNSVEIAYLEERVERCEKYAQLEIHAADESPFLRRQAELLYESCLRELRQFEDSVLILRARVASNGEIPESLLAVLGSSFTAHAGWPDGRYEKLENPIYSGGYRIRRPHDEAELHAMVSEYNIAAKSPWAPSTAPIGLEALLHLFDLTEAVSAFRLPLPIEGVFPGLETLSFVRKPAPSHLPEQGVLVGRRHEHDQFREIRIPSADRLRHTYIVGQTGTGKSTLLKTMLLDDARSGGGFCLIDPHGDLVDDVIASLPKNRLDDVVYINPLDLDHPISINLLKVSSSVERDFIVNYMIEMFYMLYDKAIIGGPMFEMYLRGTLMLLLCQPEGFIPCFMDVLTVLQSRKHRRRLLETCTNSLVKNFWIDEAEKAGGDIDLSNIVPYITSKFSAFLYNDTLKAIMSNRESRMDFSRYMDEGKIILVDLHKGLLGSTNSYFLGMIIVGELIRASMSRGSRKVSNPRNFLLYIDEFQTVATPSLMNILSEARKYGLGAVLANQYVDQLSEDIVKSVIGNVGTIVAFRIGKKDAELFSQVFAGVVEQDELLISPNFHAYIRPLLNGEVVSAFDMETILPLVPVDMNNKKKILAIAHKRWSVTAHAAAIESDDEDSTPYSILDNDDKETDGEDLDSEIKKLNAMFRGEDIDILENGEKVELEKPEVS